MRTALNEQDARTAERTVHSLKGSSNNLGVRGMAALCSQLEAQLRNEASAGALVTLAQLDDEFARVREALAGELEMV